MITRIDSENELFFRAIARRSPVELGSEYARTIVVLHPGSEIKDDGGFPFRAPNSDDERLGEMRERELERVFLSVLGSRFACSLAVYAGFLHGENFQKLINPEGVKYDGDLRYILFNGELGESLFSTVSSRWSASHIVELSFLWARDRSWLMASTPDTAVTIIGCNDELADSLIAAKNLDAFDWPLSDQMIP
ncbi:hypothetical protein [Timonella senegalensis]|uniref:hypothetical protein n=1 Tax=Timonella senegalensis TaxID=1465825 RepID=UPI0028A5D2A9|nr:hypothetical protein [Timonella senegalensis]